jgi:hypothetical protein
MKEHPIIFNTTMVQAILEGRKTKTRRLPGLNEINENPDDWQFEWADFALKKPYRFTQKSSVNEKSLADRSFNQAEAVCPYGKKSDVLWVRESFVPERVFIDQLYKADFDAVEQKDFKWKPSIHMPRSAARIFLKVESIRVERVQEIKQDDVAKEGVTEELIRNNNPIDLFRILWNGINGKRASWESNPFVWVVEFSRIGEKK